MAVYLEVVSGTSTPTSGSRQVLAGDQCLVMYLGGTPTAGSAHPGGVNMTMADGSVRVARDLDDIAGQLARTPVSGGVIILGPASRTGYLSTRWRLTPTSQQLPSLGLTSAGGPAILIGLLLPAVQAAREAARSRSPSPAIQQLRKAVGPSGHVFVLGTKNELIAL